MLESVNEPKVCAVGMHWWRCCHPHACLCWQQDAARVLVNTADQRGSMDNICVLVVDLRHQF